MITQGISVIIPNFNGRLLLPEVIPPLILALKKIDTPNEIIVVDDCSTDDSIGYLQLNYKEIIVMQNDANKGFAVTINKGIFKSKYKLLLLLNSDVKLNEDYFLPLMKYFDRPDTFGVMGKIIGWDNDKIQDGGKYPYLQGAKIKTSGNYVPLNPLKDTWLYSMYLSGANAFVEREKIIELNGFDEIFSPYYIEDYELSLRAWRLGYKCYYEHSAVCRHRISFTIKSHRKKHAVAVVYNRNKMYLHAIHLSGLAKLSWYLQLAGELILRTFSFKFYYVKSFYLFLKNKNCISLSRNKFSMLAKNNGKKISVNQVVKTIKSSLADKLIERF